MKPKMRILPFGLAVVLTLLALGYGGIGLWGRSQWSAAKKELLGRGEPISLSEMIPPEIPEAENFHATPSWKALALAEEQLRSGQIDQEEFRKRNPFRAEMVKDANGKDVPLTHAGRRGGNHDQLTDLEGFARAYQENNLAAASGKEAAEVVLEGLKAKEALLTEIAEAAKRPHGRFLTQINPARYLETPLPHIPQHQNLAQLLGLRAIAKMKSGDAHGAAEDIRLILRLAKALESDPFVISKLVSSNCMALAASAFWECTVIGTWREEELEGLQAAFASCHPVEDMIQGLRAERGLLNEWMSLEPSGKELLNLVQQQEAIAPHQGNKVPPWVVRAYPRGLLLAEQAEVNRSIQRVIDILQKRDGKAAMALKSDYSPPTARHLLALAGSIDRMPFARKALTTQSQLDLAILACALERYRMRHGDFPSSLEELAPTYLAAPPIDLFTGKPITYEKRGAENYRLECAVMKSELGATLVWNRIPQT